MEVNLCTASCIGSPVSTNPGSAAPAPAAGSLNSSSERGSVAMCNAVLISFIFVALGFEANSFCISTRFDSGTPA